ncbi:hypothetical protein [Corynebacterium sp.]|uniref:hypothetical protein n=1 Tax=Corynebacterium sp. TaxID=1720 RepID=UPI0028A61DEE|nr:hypothetical protein [Corynebacterium sp.]
MILSAPQTPSLRDRATLLFAQDGGGLPEPPGERVNPPAGSDSTLSEIFAIGLAAVIFVAFLFLLGCFIAISWDESDFGQVNRKTLNQLITWLIVLIVVSCIGEIVTVLFFIEPL